LLLRVSYELELKVTQNRMAQQPLLWAE